MEIAKPAEVHTLPKQSSMDTRAEKDAAIAVKNLRQLKLDFNNSIDALIRCAEDYHADCNAAMETIRKAFFK